MAKRKRTRGIRGAGTITQLPGGQWRLRVTLGGRQVDYGFYPTEELAGDAQARWRLTHLLPEDDPQQVVGRPASVAVGGIRCDEWFARWQDAKRARRSRVRVNNKRGGADSTAARDRAYWSKWWAPAIDDSCLIRVLAEEHEEPSESAEQVGGETVLASLAELPGAGPIEVRLLTFTPQIVGLAEPLPTNMAVRITELVAWIALQGTKGTTSASMLDHGIVGATSTKTLYNMVSAARAALGTEASGASRLIADRSTGVYRLADEVTVDVLRFVQMAERGIDSQDPHAAAELCRVALNLIDDTPVGNGSGRYGWWSSMWEARIGRLATKAAGRLAELARHGLIDLEVARTGIERARLAADGEGELHRVAMVLEAWADNDERVEREWRVACAQAENLEAGSAPGAATESILVATRRRRRLEDEGGEMRG